MELTAKGNGIFLEGPPGIRLLHSPDAAVDIVGACLEHGVHSVLLYADNLTERFFDLSSGEAGAILQKLRNYHIRLAVVLPEGGSPQSTKFREMVAEERQGSDFRIFDDRDSAVAWLMRDTDK
jgi:hypothetical protein